jgi:hypothetical protein
MTFPSLRGKSLPKAPAGKKLALDSKAGCVVFVVAPEIKVCSEWPLAIGTTNVSKRTSFST